ncbi:MAG: hypothetical protein AAF657_23795 [Acidobacteriota bacterium]
MSQRIVLLGVCIWLVTGALPASPPPDGEPQSEQETGETSAEQEIIEQILALQKQIDELMRRLPESARQAARARLAAASRAAEPAASPSAPPTQTADSAPAASQAAAQTPAKTAAATPAAPPSEPPPAPTATTTGAAAQPHLNEPPQQTAAIDPATAPGPLPLLKRRTPRSVCNTLTPLDENQDGQINSADRYWRYIYLWLDKNRDGQMQDREVESAYERGVREIAASVETFTRRRGSLGETRVRDRIVLDLSGDGFSERARKDDGVLVIDASAIRRGNGPQLLDAGSEALSGFQIFRSGLTIQLGSGQQTALTCP